MDSAIHQATLREPSGDSDQYSLHVISGRSSSNCTARGDYEVERTGDNAVAVRIFHYNTAGPMTMCTRDWLVDEYMVPLGDDIRTGEEYSVTVNRDTTVTFKAE